MEVLLLLFKAKRRENTNAVGIYILFFLFEQELQWLQVR